MVRCVDKSWDFLKATPAPPGGAKVDEELALVTDWLLCATSQVAPIYFQLPVADLEDPQYRERVYCYELYHRWRCHWPGEFRFSLGGEVDKSGHPRIRGNRLDKVKPDFLVHVPGQMDDSNLLVMEVKPGNVPLTRMAADIAKLHDFRVAPAHYRAAYFLVYGFSLDDWHGFRAELAQLVSAEGGVDPAVVRCLVHAQPGSRAVFVPLA
jgi:hypothetical protein